MAYNAAYNSVHMEGYPRQNQPESSNHSEYGHPLNLPSHEEHEALSNLEPSSSRDRSSYYEIYPERRGSAVLQSPSYVSGGHRYWVISGDQLGTNVRDFGWRD